MSDGILLQSFPNKSTSLKISLSVQSLFTTRHFFSLLSSHRFRRMVRQYKADDGKGT